MSDYWCVYGKKGRKDKTQCFEKEHNAQEYAWHLRALGFRNVAVRKR